MKKPPPAQRKHVPANPLLYEINTAVWLEGLSRRHGRQITFDSVPPLELDAIASHGFTYVWLMGIWTRSPETRKTLLSIESWRDDFSRALPNWDEHSIFGTPLSIAGYEPDPRFGNFQSLEKFRAQCAARGMGLVLDVVANHTALDHPWVSHSPMRYLRGTAEDQTAQPDAFIRIDLEAPLVMACGRDPFFPPWPGTAQLDMFNDETRKALIAEFKNVADHCDGIVAHLAQLSLNDIFYNNWSAFLDAISSQPRSEFWSDAIKAVRNVVWIAEAYWETEWTLQQQGFDYTFDKKFYDYLLSGDAGKIRLHLRSELDFQRRCVRFIENHNEPRAAYAFGEQHLKAPSVLLSTVPGMRLFHLGQLLGQKVRVPLPMSEARENALSIQVMGLYDKLLQLSHSSLFGDGQWLIRDVSRAYDDTADNLIAYTWSYTNALSLVIVNPSRTKSQGMVPLYDAVEPSKEYVLVDELTGTRYRRNGRQLFYPGLHVILDPFDAHILRVETV